MNNFLPTPLELKHVEANDTKRPKLFKKYGAHDWYQWCVKNWGTKWDVKNYCKPEVSKNEIIYHFDTAWGPPIEFIMNIAPLFHKLKFWLEYSEPGMVFSGELKIQDQKIIENIERDGEVWPEHKYNEDEE